MGGTNLRVCLVELHGDTTYHAIHSKKSVPPELMVTHDGEKLFAFLADQVELLLQTHIPDCLNKSANLDILSLGLTFSFPVYQSSIDSGILLGWTKGFDIPSVVGQDVCGLLQHQIDIRKLPVKVSALVNDAAGTIMTRAYTLPISQRRTTISTIFGTGTNAVYLEKLSKVLKPLEGHLDRSTGEMLISIEWGSFDNDLSVLPINEYDVEVDQASINRGNQMFEKRVSGMFLGELLRTILARLHIDPFIKLFEGLDVSIDPGNARNLPLHTRWAVDSSILSTAEMDDTRDLMIIRQNIVDTLGIPSPFVGVDDAKTVKIIAHAIGKRAARLSGMALGAVILKTEKLAIKDSFRPWEQSSEINDEDGKIIINVANPLTEECMPMGKNSSLSSGKDCLVDVEFDGSVIEFYPGFEMHMREVLRVVDGIGTTGEKTMRMGLAKEGSSVGAAIVALMAAQQT